MQVFPCSYVFWVPLMRCRRNFRQCIPSIFEVSLLFMLWAFLFFIYILFIFWMNMSFFLFLSLLCMVTMTISRRVSKAVHFSLSHSSFAYFYLFFCLTSDIFHHSLTFLLSLSRQLGTFMSSSSSSLFFLSHSLTSLDHPLRSSISNSWGLLSFYICSQFHKYTSFCKWNHPIV